MLFGIRSEGGGLGSNADELRDAFSLFNNTVVLPFQNILLKGLKKIFKINDINLDLYFKTLKPADFIDLDVTETQSEDDAEKEGVTSEEDFVEMSDDEMNIVFEDLEGEQIDDEWEVVDEREQGSDETYEDWAKRLIEENKKFAKDQIDSKPSGFSYLDKSFYKIRFKYAIGSRKSSSSTRTFCKNMMRRTKQKIVYRIEDIDKASREGVNRQLGHKGRPYDLFRFKGGIYCRHKWVEVLYRLKKSTKVKKGAEMPLDIADYKKVSSIPKSYKTKPRGYKDAILAPENMPDRGAYPK